MKSTERDFINEIIRLRLGDARRHQQPLNNSEIADKLGVGRDFVIEKLKLAAKHGLCKISDTGRLELPEATKQAQTFARYDGDDFLDDPIVKEWIDHLTNKGKGTWRQDYNRLKNYCNTFHKRPEQLLNPIIKDWKDLAATLEKEKAAFLRGECIHDKTKKGLSTEDLDNIFHWFVQSIRIFVTFHGISIPKNIGGILSGKVRGHAQYADIRLTFEEIAKAKEYIVSKWGTDSDIFRIFCVGIESGARASALLNMECVWEATQHPITNQTIYVMKAYESKTKSWWKKYITWPETQQSLSSHRAKNKWTKIVSTEHTTNLSSQIYRVLTEQLREVYCHLGKDRVHLDKKGVSYFIKKPFHTLRHISAQYYIKITDGNYTAVTFFCGWKSEIELRASYGEMPPEVFLKNLKGVDFGSFAGSVTA